MLVLTRKPGEVVCIGEAITVTVVEVRGLQVRLGITAPDEVHISRPDAHNKKPLPGNKRWEP